MNWFTAIIVSIGAAFSSLFGMSHPAATSTTTLSVPVQQVAPMPQVSDEQSVINSVTAMLEAYRSASTLQDIQNLMSQYASQAEVQQFQTAISKVPSSSLASVQTELITVAHAYPNPTTLRFTTTINGNMATTTAQLPTTVSTSTENYNNKPNSEIITSTYQNSLTVNLVKENDQWKVSTITVSSKGIGNQYSPNNK